MASQTNVQRCDVKSAIGSHETDALLGHGNMFVDKLNENEKGEGASSTRNVGLYLQAPSDLAPLRNSTDTGLPKGFALGVIFSFASLFLSNRFPTSNETAKTMESGNLSTLTSILPQKHKSIRIATDEMAEPEKAMKVSLGPRPFFLIDQISSIHPLKAELQKCVDDIDIYEKSDFVIGHRGASLQFPEHTFRSHTAASRMGAGIVECDVTFTKDHQLICRHSQCDLHRTTDVLLRPDLASRCRSPFVPSFYDAQGRHLKAYAKCCTTDFTLDEIQSLCGKMDAVNAYATSPESYVKAHPGLPPFRTDLYSHDCPKIPSHLEYIANVHSHEGKFTPELKVPDAGTIMPFTSDFGDTPFSREAYATQMIQDYIDLGIGPDRVHPQAFDWNDLFFWSQHFPEYAQNGFALDSVKNETVLNSRDELVKHFQPLVDNGIKTVAPAIWMLVTTAPSPAAATNSTVPSLRIVPSLYAKVAKEDMGLDIVAWTLERSDSLALKPGYYYQSVADAVESDGDIFTVLDVLARQVKIKGIFSDFASTVTLYANCFDL